MKFLSVSTFLLVCLYFSAECNSANILFFFGVSTYSHRIAVWPLVEKLVEEGHNATFFQPYPNKNPNPKITEINPKLEQEFVLPDFLQHRLDGGSSGRLSLSLPNMGIALCENFLKDPAVIEWIKGSHFDLVVIDSLYNDCGLGLAYKFGAKHVTFATSTVFGFWPDVYGFPAENSWIPEIHFPSEQPMGFFSRVKSTVIMLMLYFQKQYLMQPSLEKILRDKLEIPDMPPLHEIESNASLILMNTHFSEELARSLPPFVIPVGGIHIREKINPLPKAFSKFINDGGDNGFIYVSFGSAASFSKTPKEFQQMFFNAMKKIKAQFIWRWDGPRPKNVPVNVITVDWMPQQDVLGHPKIRGFITHGGLLGIQEAIHHSIPMIVLPIFAEQDYNAQRMHRTKRGIVLEMVTLTENKLEDAINKILTDDSYRSNMKELSKLFSDRPQSPLDTAVWWIEYILRHDDTSFMRPYMSASQTWYQRRLLDVWAFIFIVLISVSTFFIVILIKISRKVCSIKSQLQEGKTKTS